MPFDAIPMLLPTQMQQMHLGVVLDAEPVKFDSIESIEATPPVFAYGRVEDTPRVTGFNNTVGDCFPTACCNAVQTALGLRGVYTPISNNLPVTIYSATTGYVPGNAATDIGTTSKQMFGWWKNNAINGYKSNLPKCYAGTDIGTLRRLIQTKGGVIAIIGLAVQQQNERVWSGTGVPGTWGWHAVWIDMFDGLLTFCTSWGLSQPIDESFFAKGFVNQIWDVDLIAA
jgi:hypothetical protein